ncbi:MAG: hypothetical protein A2452_13380 [Candidatus Firestonebacteria bacterium RIFOXYC2_FULL_39_67]|nr:MAG: hypothetical protein A2536_05230 [Candidatus Firestonebacteria bacterium RIFOXYD2_FULL_39_29]OGF56198.1 MAG: hypothetical protein A2452_13380 [Candidatus Firestonebacteria bacterium RIFOXYC2_FULL_39_67]OGF57277.1 MAG: hypothetical protein A2497_03610 [Candidatus Firestonebacteria bacterium RifOxyC12_full_39_7]
MFGGRITRFARTIQPFSEHFFKFLYAAHKSQKTGKLHVQKIRFALVCMLFVSYTRKNGETQHNLARKHSENCWIMLGF